MDARINTNELLEAIEEGIVDKDYALTACLKFMSESDVLEMMRANEITCNECGEIECRNWRECLVNATYGDGMKRSLPIGAEKSLSFTRPVYRRGGAK